MKKNLLVMFFLFSAIYFLSSDISAAMDHLIRFQGVAADNQGNPLTSQHKVIFRIYDAQTGGNLKWIEPIPGDALMYINCDANGNFSHLLGERNPLGLSLFSESELWISIQIDNRPPLPRQRITPSPLAVRSEWAENAEVAINLTDDNVSIPGNKNFINIPTTSITMPVQNNQLASKAYADTKITIPSNSQQGDILIRDASGWTRLAAGLLGQALVTQGSGNNPEWATPSSTKCGFISWSSGTGGSLQITGIGFKPSSGIFIVSIDWSTPGYSTGLAYTNSNACIYTGTNGATGYSSSYVYFMKGAGSQNDSAGRILSWDDDGFTIYRALAVGLNTISMHYMVFK